MRRTIFVLLATAMVALAIGGPLQSATAAETTDTSNITLEGTSPQQNLGGISATCDECFPDDLFSCGGCEVAGRAEASALTSVSWTAPVSITSTFDPEQLHQGAAAAVSNALSPQPGTISIDYDIPYVIGLFGRNGDFPAGPGWHASTDSISGTFEASTSAPCSVPLSGTTTCNKVDTINVVPETCFFTLCALDITVDLVVTHVFTVGAGGIVAHRQATFEPDTNRTFNGPVPALVADSVDVPCTATVGAPVGYHLDNLSYTPSSVSVAGSAGLHVIFDGPGPLNADPTIGLVSGPVFDTAVAGPLVMAGTSAHDVALGNVLLDNVAPTISAVVQGGTFVEGSDVSFTSVVTDNCASGLANEWQFSDGGRAYSSPAAHAFADDGSGYTARLVATDAAGNADTYDFGVNPIANANPSVGSPADATALWGVPVSFHADAADPGPADQPTLHFTWAFGDGTGASGADVSHAYTGPGTYPVVVSVSDKDGGLGTAGLTAEITKRHTTLVYTGATQGLANKYVALSATLTDERGRPVTGRIVTFTLGSQTATASTNSAGLASTTLRLNQKNGNYPVSANFTGDSLYVGDASDLGTFKIGK